MFDITMRDLSISVVSSFAHSHQQMSIDITTFLSFPVKRIKMSRVFINTPTAQKFG